jgi:hypothetical protein
VIEDLIRKFEAKIARQQGFVQIGLLSSSTMLSIYINKNISFAEPALIKRN